MIQSLCNTCCHVKEVFSAKGFKCLLCQLSQQDRRYPKYPPQPLVKCVGYGSPKEGSHRTS
jgi:hypothetical protein